MPTFKQIVKSVGAILLNHPIGQVPSIKAFWKNCEFKIMNEQGQGHAALEPYENAILLYPSLEMLPQAQAEAEILRQFGMYLVRQGRGREPCHGRNYDRRIDGRRGGIGS